MDRRLLIITLAAASLFLAAGLLLADRPVAEWVRASGIESAAVFVYGLGTLDWLGGMRLSIWLAGAVALVLGAAGLALQRSARWPRALIAAAVVQYATIASMIVGKDHFGRLRPFQVLRSGDWSQVWFAGGGSFPSGHSAFYFGLLLPLAAAAPPGWLRRLLIAIPVFAVLARVDMAKHFVSDVSASAVLAALYALIAATAIRRWLPAPVRPA